MSTVRMSNSKKERKKFSFLRLWDLNKRKFTIFGKSFVERDPWTSNVFRGTSSRFYINRASPVPSPFTIQLSHLGKLPLLRKRFPRLLSDHGRVGTSCVSEDPFLECKPTLHRPLSKDPDYPYYLNY